MSDQYGNGSEDPNTGGAIQPSGGWTPSAGTPPPGAPSPWGSPASGPSDAPPPPSSPYDQPTWGQPQPGYGQQYTPPQPGAAYGQPMYQQYGYAPGVGSTTNPYESRGSTIMVLGILSLVICGLLGPVAWIMGKNLKSEAEAAGWPEPGNAKAGRICGTVATCLMIAGILFYVLFFVVLATSSSLN